MALDSFPYNGTTTTFDALWMGVPTVSLRGDRHASRVGASILTRAGLQDLVTDSEQAYTERAVALARDKDRLQHIRANTGKLKSVHPGIVENEILKLNPIHQAFLSAA